MKVKPIVQIEINKIAGYEIEEKYKILGFQDIYWIDTIEEALGVIKKELEDLDAKPKPTPPQTNSDETCGSDQRRNCEDDES